MLQYVNTIFSSLIFLKTTKKPHDRGLAVKQDTEALAASPSIESECVLGGRNRNGVDVNKIVF